jgi:hypothetical protein
MTALHDAIAEQLNRLLAQGITPKTLTKIERFARAQREALIAVDTGEGAFDGRLGTLGFGAGGFNPSVDDNGEATGLALTSAPAAETYGANVLRQIMGPLQNALGRIGRPPPAPENRATDLVNAMVAAAKGELGEDVLGPLREKLREVLADGDADDTAFPPETADVFQPPEMLDASPDGNDPSFDAAFVGGLAMGLAHGSARKTGDTP